MGRTSEEGGLPWKGTLPLTPGKARCPRAWRNYGAQDRAGQTDAVWAQGGGGLTPKFSGWTALKTWIGTGSLV